MSRHYASLLCTILIVLAACSTEADSPHRTGLQFTAGPCDSAQADPWDKSTLGVKKVEWVDNDTLKVKAFVGLNCASKIARGEFEIVNDTIILKYVWHNPTRDGQEMITHCMCAQELNYLIKHLEKKDYRFRLESIKEPGM